MTLQDAFYEFTPMYYATVICGLSPYRFAITNDKRTFYSSKYLSICSVIAAIVFDIYSFFYYEDILNALTEVAKASQASPKLYQCLHALQFFLVNLFVFISVFKSKKVYNCFLVLDECDELLKQYGVHVKKNFNRNICYVFVFGSTLLNLLETINSFISTHTNHSVVNIWVIISIMTVVKYQIIIWCFIITERFKNINEYLSTFSKFDELKKVSSISSAFKDNIRRMVFTSNDLKHFCKTHTKLCQATRELNDVFSIHILSGSSVYFFWLTLHTFGVVGYISTFNTHSYNYFLYNLLWFHLTTFEFTLFVWSCWRVSHHVSTINIVIFI